MQGVQGCALENPAQFRSDTHWVKLVHRKDYDLLTCRT
jgi:hypothetical protein